MNLKEWLIVESPEEQENAYLIIKDDKSYILEEWPNAKFFKFKDYQDKGVVADLMIQVIGSDLENANYSQCGGLEEKLYRNMIKAGISKVVAADVIFESFKDLV